MDAAVPTVFPDYQIQIGGPGAAIAVPNGLPWVDILPDRIQLPSMKIGNLGHAGVLLINGTTGVTRYYEYGRYDTASLGLVRRVGVPNVTIKDGRPKPHSLQLTLAFISIHSGQKGRIKAAYIDVDSEYQKMVEFAEKKQRENRDPKREPYKILTHSCLHFMKNTIEAAGVTMPTILDPRPDGYIDKVREAFPLLDYTPAAPKPGKK